MVNAAERSIALIGPSGVGKSTVGRRLAEQLGWPFIDLDALIEQRAGLPISEIFAREGEAGFRERESVLLVEALDQAPMVISCGGGVVVRMFNRNLLRDRAWCVYLIGSLPVLVERLVNDVDNPRPLLEDGLAERLAMIIGERRALYGGLAQWTIHTDQLDVSAVVEEIMHGWQRTNSADPALVAVAGGTYRVQVGQFENLPQELDQLGLHGPCWLISDTTVGPLYAATVQQVLQRSDRRCEVFQVPAGEQSKSLVQAEHLYTWLLEQGVQRGDTVLALGGGVVGDLAGFVAATTLRGIAYVQLPTTILAMIDSSIGGKTGVNHQRGKNLIGAFHQPRLVLIDARVLSTLPQRERAAGWAEAIKHGVIADAALFDLLEQAGAGLVDLPAHTAELLRRSAAVKIGVVNRDEREQGERMLLNYGHTLGQAIEAATHYTRYLHGEAVAIGMVFAAELAVQRGLFARAEAERQQQLLAQIGLPTMPPEDLDVAATLAALSLDKKRADGNLRWILPTSIGHAAVYSDVPREAVEQLLHHMLANVKHQVS